MTNQWKKAWGNKSCIIEDTHKILYSGSELCFSLLGKKL